MAISRDKKESIVAKLSNLLGESRLVILARYSGLSVADMQMLRREAKQSEVAVVVAKNRLVKLALAANPDYKETDSGLISGQLLLAIGSDDVMPAQVAAKFGKTHPKLEIVGGFTNDGTILSVDEITALANLPSREVLLAHLVGTVAAPLSGFVNVLGGNLRGLVNVLNARAEAIK